MKHRHHGEGGINEHKLGGNLGTRPFGGWLVVGLYNVDMSIDFVANNVVANEELTKVWQWTWVGRWGLLTM